MRMHVCVLTPQLKSVACVCVCVYAPRPQPQPQPQLWLRLLWLWLWLWLLWLSLWPLWLWLRSAYGCIRKGWWPGGLHTYAYACMHTRIRQPRWF